MGLDEEMHEVEGGPAGDYVVNCIFELLVVAKTLKEV